MNFYALKKKSSDYSKYSNKSYNKRKTRKNYIGSGIRNKKRNIEQRVQKEVDETNVNYDQIVYYHRDKFALYMGKETIKDFENKNKDKKLKNRVMFSKRTEKKLNAFFEGENFLNEHYKEDIIEKSEAFIIKEKTVNYKRVEFEKKPFLLERLKETYTTWFTFKKFVNFYKIYHPLSYDHVFFYKYNIFLGYSRAVTHFRNSNYLVGSYFGVSMIDINYLMNNFRVHTYSMSKVLINKFMSTYVANEIIHDFLAKGYIRWFNYFEMGYFFGNWWKGFFKNYKIFSTHPSVAFKEFSFYNGRFPGYVFFLGVPAESNHTSLYYLNKELISLRMPSIMFFDTRHSTEWIMSPVLSNNKNYFYNLFYIKIIICIFIRLYFIKKKNFLIKMIKKNIRYSYLKPGFLSEEYPHDEITHIKNPNVVLPRLYSDMLFLLIKKKKIQLLLNRARNFII